MKLKVVILSAQDLSLRNLKDKERQYINLNHKGVPSPFVVTSMGVGSAAQRFATVSMMSTYNPNYNVAHLNCNNTYMMKYVLF